MNTFIIALCGREIFINEDLSLPQICQIDIEDNSRYIPVAIDSEDKYLAIRLSEEEAKSISSLQRSELRPLYNKMPQQQFKACGKSLQMIHWKEHSRYCPSCGTATIPFMSNATKCPSCGYEIFPMIAPAAIVLVTKGDELLLVKARNFRSNHYGLVAGFLEVGETLEECVERELKEEVGLKVTNIKYFGNQPWPFPSGLMIGFTAEYVSGEITLQEDELTHGAFFHYTALPQLPGEMSIARQMINAFIASKREK